MGEKSFCSLLALQAFHKLVVKLQIVLSMPEQVLIRQEDAPDVVPINMNPDEDEKNEEPVEEKRMYFIAKGKYDVYVKKNHIVSVNQYSENSKEKPDRSLQDGEHFGEIGLIYGCKRTATVESANYGTLAMLNFDSYKELQKSFENIGELFKKQICLYDDEVKIFLEMACDKIDYFRNLSFMTK